MLTAKQATVTTKAWERTSAFLSSVFQTIRNSQKEKFTQKMQLQPNPRQRPTTPRPPASGDISTSGQALGLRRVPRNQVSSIARLQRTSLGTRAPSCQGTRWGRGARKKPWRLPAAAGLPRASLRDSDQPHEGSGSALARGQLTAPQETHSHGGGSPEQGLGTRLRGFGFSSTFSRLPKFL